jgi:SAM-dependent methyltransferase
MDDWIDYYDSAHTIYVNARHRDVHFRVIAEDLAQYVAGTGWRVLDYGCGEALHADLVAAKAARLTLVEPAPGVRARIAARFKAQQNIDVKAPDDLARYPDASFDLIVMHSVAQYLTPQELDNTLALFRRLIAPEGLLVLGDVLQPGTLAATDAVALLRFGWQQGFFVAAAAGLLRTFFSSYWRLRSSLGLTRYAEPALIARLAAAGFAARRAPHNVGHNDARMTFLARPASGIR